MNAAQRFSIKACIAATLLFVSGAALPQPAPAPRQAPDDVNKNAGKSAGKGAPAKATHLLHLSAVRLEASGWTDESALQVLRGAGRMLTQCRVKLERVELVSLEVPPQYLDLASPVSPELVRDYSVARPTVYFVRVTRGSPAFQSEGFGRSTPKSRSVLADTVWITATARDPAVALARELARVLMDSDAPSDEPGNLMRGETAAQNTALTPAQCARLRDTASRNGLLKKAK